MININDPKLFTSHVHITRPKSKDHLEVCDMSTEGRIVECDPSHKEGKTTRPLLVEFKDGRRSWWQPWELSYLDNDAIEQNLNPNLYIPIFPAQYNIQGIALHLGLNLTKAQQTIMLNAALAELHEEGAWTDFNITQKEAMTIASKIAGILDMASIASTKENE